MCNRLDRIPACDGQTDEQTYCHGIVRVMYTCRVVKINQESNKFNSNKIVISLQTKDGLGLVRFLPRDAMHCVDYVVARCPSVCLSVYLSAGAYLEGAELAPPPLNSANIRPNADCLA